MWRELEGPKEIGLTRGDVDEVGEMLRPQQEGFPQTAPIDEVGPRQCPRLGTYV